MFFLYFQIVHMCLWYAGKTASKRSGWAYWGTFPESLFAKKRKVTMGVVLSAVFGDLVWEALESWGAACLECSCSLRCKGPVQEILIAEDMVHVYLAPCSTQTKGRPLSVSDFKRHGLQTT